MWRIRLHEVAQECRLTRTTGGEVVFDSQSRLIPARIQTS
jgi:hypothetical protein